MFELCLCLGSPHPDYLCELLTRKQLNEWFAFHSLSPIGERRADTRIALQTYHLRQAWVEGGEESPKDFRPQFPIYQDEEPDETEEDIVNREERESSQFA